MQTKRHSIIEAITNTFIGMVLAFSISQIAVWVSPFIPGFTWEIGVTDNMIMTIVLTIVSILRGYVIRRWFNKRLLAAYKELLKE